MKRILQRLKHIGENAIGMNRRNLELIYEHNPRPNYKFADDKALAKSILEEAAITCPRTYAKVEHMGQIEECWNSVAHHRMLVVKPAKGAGGKGILILKRENGDWYAGGDSMPEHDIFVHIANILFGIYSFGDDDVAIIEECINPHPFFHRIFPAGVPDIRIILLNGRPLQAMLRMPTRRSGGKANIHQGGIAIGIDMIDGSLGSVYDGKRHTHTHPDSMIPISGQVVPHWEVVKDLARQAVSHFPLNYLGVDIVIDKDRGPMVMEVNVRPGLTIQMANRRGLAQEIATNQIN